MWRCGLLVLLWTTSAVAQTLTLQEQTCDASRRSASSDTTNANVLLGGLFNIREPGTDGIGCVLTSTELMQTYEAARWTIRQLNDNNYVNGIRFGMEAFDTCGLEGNALAAVHQFYPQSISRGGTSNSGVNYCTATSNTLKLGLIGPMRSSEAIPVAEMLPIIPASIISMRATSPNLSNKNKFPTFLRTDQPVSSFARAGGKLLKELQWEKIVVVYTDDAYGIGGYREILQAANEADICVSEAISVPMAGTVADHQAKLRNIGSLGVTAAVFYGNPTDALLTLQALQALINQGTAGVSNIKWLFGQLELERDYSAYTAAQGALVVQTTVTTISDFKTYYTNLNVNNPPSENPWLQDWYMNKYQCRLSGVNYAPFNTMPGCQTGTNPRPQDFRQSPYVEQTVMAIYAYAEAVKQVCARSANPCTSTLRNIDPLTFHNTYLSKVDFTFPTNFVIPELRSRRIAFDVNGDPLTSSYTFYNYNSNNGPFAFQEFGSYTNGALQITTTPVFPRPGSVTLTVPSLCPASGCSNCLLSTSRLTLAYKPGDLVVAALVNAHESGQRGLTCAEVIPDRMIEAVAARYAADTSNVLTNRGVSMGYLIVDVCPGMTSAQSFLTNLLGGYRTYVTDDGRSITAVNIVAVFDMTPEDTGMVIAPQLKSRNLVQFRVAPSSGMLLHNRMYPGIISNVPSQDSVQLALVQMLASLQLKYVQVVSEASGSFYRAAEDFRRLASSMDVCVALWSTLDMDPVAIVHRMRDVQSTSVVVVFASSGNMRALLQAVKTVVTSDPNLQRQLTFVSGSELYGTSDNIVAGFASEADGSLFIQLSQRVNPQMDTWLSRLTLSEIASDAFLAQWFEYKLDCSLTSSSRGRYDRVCHNTDTINLGQVYQSYAPYVIEGINGLAIAVDSLLNTYCGVNTGGMCSQFRSLDDLGEKIVGIMRNSGDNTAFRIVNGEGMTDLTFFNANGNAFSEVGRFDTSNQRIASLEESQILVANGQRVSPVQCVGRCIQCQQTFTTQDVSYTPGDLLISSVSSISNPGPEGQQPFVCGDIRAVNGYQDSTAVLYALNRINSGRVPGLMLNNVTLGALIMDHCSNARRTYGLVSDVYSGWTELAWRDMMGRTSRFDSSDIMAWMTDTSTSTMEAAEILETLRVPIVSQSATAASLMDNPTFFRTVKGDDTIAMALVKLCKTLGIVYIQVVHSDSSYGRSGLSTVTNLARQEGLCVINSFELADPANATETVNKVVAGTSKVVILYMGTSLTTAFLGAAAQLSSADQLLILSPEPYTAAVSSTPNRNRLTNLLSLKLHTTTIADYNNYLNDVATNSQNPFFARYYMKHFQCNLPGYYMYPTNCNNQPLTTSSGYVEDSYIMSTINAVYAVAAALHNTLIEFCGQNYNGECMEFKASRNVHERLVEHLKIVRFQDPNNSTFNFLEREGNVLYDVLRFNGINYEKVGTYGGASLRLTNTAQLQALYTGVVSQCSTTCSECVFDSLSFSHTAGDIYLGGVFDVHEQGQGVFDCGRINTEHGFQLLEAFHFALQQVNNKRGVFANILSGVNLGGVGLDACQSAIRGGYLVSNINNGLTRLVRDGVEISPEEIDVYIGSYSSDSSIYLARILTDLRTPQISYASSSNALGNRLIYPYFFRTVPADDKQVLGMLKYLDKNDLRYVQLLYTDDSFGNQGVAQFERIIKQQDFSVCIAQQVMFPESGVVSKESSDDVVAKLLQKPVANTVVIFASTRHIQAFLKAVGRSQRASETFKFVGPTTWGDRSIVTEDISDIADDAVTFVLDFQGGVGGFHETYLTQRNPSNAGNNPWFEEYFQVMLNCYTSPSNSGQFPRACNPNANLKTRVIEDNGVLHVMNAVYAAAFALDATLKDKCGENYMAVCEAYRNSKERRTDIRNNLDKVNFTDPTNTEFRFEDREGNKGYKLLKLTSSPLDAEVVYSQTPIGTFSSDGDLRLHMDLTPKYPGNCQRKDACVECPTIRNPGTRYAVGGDLSSSVTVVGVFDVHNRGAEMYQCGSINLQGFLKFLTFFWTYGMAASRSNIRLLAVDTCSSSMRAGQYLYGLLNDGTLCNVDDFDLRNLGLGNIGAVVVSGQENVFAAARVLEPLQMPYLTADSISPRLDDYEYLLRTITPWSGLVRMLATFFEESGWSYINTIYVDTDMGLEDYRVYQEIFAERKLCLAKGMAASDDTSDVDIRTMLSQLNQNDGAKVIMLFTGPDLTLRIIRQAHQLGIADDYLWVFGLHDRQFLTNIPAGVSFEALVYRRLIPSRNDFSQFVANLDYDPNNSNRNRASIPRVWWEDFFQTYHRCRLNNASFPLDFDLPCALDKRVNATDLMGSKLMHYTFLASYFAQQGLANVYSGCRQGESLQNCLERRVLTRPYIRDTILDVQLAKDGTTYRFNKPMRYIEGDFEIFYYKVKNGALEKQPELYRSFREGAFTGYNQLLPTTSTCTRPDGCGCQRDDDPYAQRQTGPAFDPTMPRNYYKYDANDEQLHQWPIWAIVVAVLTSVGLLVTLILFLYLLIAYPVKSGTSVLGYLTIIGIMGIYAINFAFFVHASAASCGARRFLMGVVYTIVFASLLVKAIDNWRFADMEYGNHQYRGLTNSLTLLLVAVGIVLIQCIIPIEWLILVHPTASKWTAMTMHDYWWCDPPELYDIGLVCSFIFVICVIVLTAVFAGLSYESESNNHESRWILVSCVATAGCFLVWMIVTTNAGPVYRDPAVAIANFVNATLLLMLIPMRKLYILYLVKNDKQPVYDNGFDPYSNVYANQTYDPEGDDYTYEPTEKTDDGFIAD